MVSMNESSGGTPLANALQAGLTDISYAATVDFTVYVRTVLPLDGYVFWVRADLVSDAVKTGLDADTYNGPTTISVPGSIHVSTETIQKDDQNLDLSHTIFTTKTEVRPFHDVGQSYVWIGNFQGIRFGINTRNNYYRQADLHHYVGSTIVPTVETQIIDDVSQLQEQELVVSNSLPFFLAMGSQSALYGFIEPPPCPIYPAYMSPDNMIPPYITVNVDETTTTALTSAAGFDENGSRWQHVSETVRLTLFGLRNDAALQALDYICNWCYVFDKIGIQNSPVIHDEKQTQPEIGALAIKKTAVLQVNYYQKYSQDISRQLIKHCIPSIDITGW